MLRRLTSRNVMEFLQRSSLLLRLAQLLERQCTFYFHCKKCRFERKHAALFIHEKAGHRAPTVDHNILLGRLLVVGGYDYPVADSNCWGKEWTQKDPDENFTKGSLKSRVVDLAQGLG